MNPHHWLLSLCVLIALTGCTKMQESQRLSSFESTVNSFRIFIRWGDYIRASNYVNLREGEPRSLDFAALKKIRVTHYDNINEVAVGDEQTGIREMLVVSELEYYNEDVMRLKSLTYKQVWWYDVEAKRWFLDGNLPDFELHPNG